MDTLRPPPLLDPTAHAYKDWLHLNVFDHASGSIGIVNASLHGSPRDPRSRAVGAALVHVPGEGWVGNMELAAVADADVGPTSIGLERVALATDPATGDVHASARLTSDNLTLSLVARPAARPIDVSAPVPFGPGWISWYARPRLGVAGEIRAGTRRLDLADAVAYHDHNWGRWHWGDDVGWQWGAFEGADGACGLTVVVPRSSAQRGDAESGHAIADVGSERRVFAGRTLRIRYEGRLAARLRRLPGALAALHQDRLAPALPARILIDAGDGIDAVAVAFRPHAAAQLIVADPDRAGYGFIHEMVGPFEATFRVAGRAHAVAGLAVFEHVDR